MMRAPRSMRAAFTLCAAVAMLAAAAGRAHAGASIANPRRENPRFDVPDSAHVAKSEFGLLLGTPAGLNLEAGYWPAPKWGVRVSGLYRGREFSGVQGNFCWTVGRNGRRRESVALVGGSIQHSGESWSYGGLAFDWNVSAFFLEGGLVVGDGDLSFGRGNSHVQLILQLGLMGGGGVLGPR